jgi:hypothetical protein
MELSRHDPPGREGTLGSNSEQGQHTTRDDEDQLRSAGEVQANNS